MVYRKKKKVTKYRGSKTHGGGSMKKRRGAGHRGGRGRAGSGKKGDGKKPSYWKEVAEKGFVGPSAEIPTMNVGHVSSVAAALVNLGKASVNAGAYTIDLNALGIKRLLGSGIVSHKLVLTVDHASARAIEKVKAAGGSVTTKEPAPVQDASIDE